MAHKTMIGGTTYSIIGGKSMVSGTVYSIASGRTLVNGSVYNINFPSPLPLPNAYAMLYDDGNFVLQRGNNVETGKTLINIYTGFENVYYTSIANVPWKKYIGKIKNVSFKDSINPISLNYWFNNARNLCNVNVNGLMLNKILYMVNTYYNCRNLTGSPVCGNNVTDMYATYSRCPNLTGSPVCGNNVTNMCLTYFSCYNLTGSPVCGNKVTNMYATYGNCYNLTGSPVCGNNVTNMHGTYANCYNLTGSPVCGNNVTSMMNTYMGCRNLTGNAYFYSPLVSNIKFCFYSRNTSTSLNIYLLNQSTTYKTALCNNTSSMVGKNIKWTNAGAYFYNTTYNIYIYPVDNVEEARLNNEQ